MRDEGGLTCLQNYRRFEDYRAHVRKRERLVKITMLRQQQLRLGSTNDVSVEVRIRLVLQGRVIASTNSRA